MWGEAVKLDLDEKDHRTDAKNISDTNTTRMVSTPAIYSRAPKKTQCDIVAISTLRDFQYEQKTLPKSKQLDGLLKEVRGECISEARKAAFGCKFSNCLRVDLKTKAMRE